ncbi:MAG TPA: SPOR domain-containing protein [Gammaproteobacteria bacterium]|nr:SPOR domain-containing protein [Gammaproteobacteria bacterium]
MDNALKQRILGIIVLFALIGICITVLLHNNKVQREAALQNSRQLIANDQTSLSTPTTTHRHHKAATTTTSLPADTTIQQTSVFSQPAVNTQPQEQSQPQQQQASTQTFENTAPAAEEHAIPLNSSTSTVQPTVTPQVVTQPSKPKSALTTSSAFSTKTLSTKAKTSKTNTNINSPLFSSTEHSKEKTKTVVTKAWAVQVGTFSDHQNAMALVKALKGRGFTATTQSVKTKHGNMTRVVIGASGLTRQQAETTKLHLSKTLQLHGILSPVTKKTAEKTERKVVHTTKSAKAKTTEHEFSKPVNAESAPTSAKASPENVGSSSINSGAAPVSAAKPSYNNSDTGANNSGAVVIP